MIASENIFTFLGTIFKDAYPVSNIIMSRLFFMNSMVGWASVICTSLGKNGFL